MTAPEAVGRSGTAIVRSAGKTFIHPILLLPVRVWIKWPHVYSGRCNCFVQQSEMVSGNISKEASSNRP
jgi:hypothetical protein